MSTYSGGRDLDVSEKEMRRFLELPVTKQLVYYTNPKDVDSKTNIISYKIIKTYEITRPWHTIEVELESGEIVKVHSKYLKEMQNPSFVADMKQMERQAGGNEWYNW